MRYVVSLTLILLLAACGGDPLWLPRAHKITIQQGNLLNQDMLERVTVGMDRELVRNLIGTPVIQSPFRQNQWDYLYTRGPAGAAISARRVSIVFKDDKVTSIEDNIEIESGEIPAKRYFWEKKDG